METKHDVMKYKCRKCDIGFKSNHDLKNHMGVVHDSKQKKCEECGQQFSYVKGKIDMKF